MLHTVCGTLHYLDFAETNSKSKFLKKHYGPSSSPSYLESDDTARQSTSVECYFALELSWFFLLPSVFEQFRNSDCKTARHYFDILAPSIRCGILLSQDSSLRSHFFSLLSLVLPSRAALCLFDSIVTFLWELLRSFSFLLWWLRQRAGRTWTWSRDAP